MMVAAFASFIFLMIMWFVLPSPSVDVKAIEYREMESQEESVSAAA